MPESQVSNAFAHQIQSTIRDASLRAGGLHPEETGRLQLFPRAFAEGTKRKPYCTISVDKGDYSEALEPESAPVHPKDAQRIAAMAPWKYLTDRILKEGPVYVGVRGKCVVIAAGHHAIVCHFSLEGNLLPLKRTEFDELVSRCVPGNNPNASKAARLRCFPLPERFVNPASRTKKQKKITVLAAIVMEDDVIIFSDFSRMSQMHIVSSNRIFQEHDVAPGSVLWNTRLWTKFNVGPDWITETDAALQRLDAWRAVVVQDRLQTPILTILLDAAGPATGIGQHLANDLLYLLALHPDTPSFTLCSSDELYFEFRNFIPKFMATWTSATYLQRCAGRPNTSNPFEFNHVSNTHFLQGYVRVYRRSEVRMPAELYNLYQSRGLFDKSHIIGAPYHGEWTPYTGQWKAVAVRQFEGHRYHVILASPPAAWDAPLEEIEFKDVTTAGFASTLGPASFYEVIQNKMDPEQATARVHPGRPRKEKTGLRGRPRKPLTLHTIERMMSVPRTTFHAKARANRAVNKENEVAEARTTRSQRKFI